MRRKILIMLLAIVFVGVVVVGFSQEQDHISYPTKSIQLIVSYTAGAATDYQARILSKYAEKILGQPIVIVNMPGAGGQVGWNHFSKASPDGYTLVAYNLPQIMVQPLVHKTQYQLEHFEPIMNWGWDPTVIAVKSNSTYSNLQDMIEDARARPGEITIGNAGLFIGQHLGTLLLEKEAGIEFQVIPYQGSTESIAALSGGHIDLIAGNLSGMLRSGDRFRILAIATQERHIYAPEIPTFKELGYPSVIMSTDRGIAAPQGTPQEIIQILTKAFDAVANDEVYQKDMEQAGGDLLFLTREEVFEEFRTRKPLLEDLLRDLGKL